MREPQEEDAEEICTLLPTLHAETDFLLWMAGEFDWPVDKEREFLRERAEDPNVLPMAAVVDGRIVGLGSVGSQGLRRFAHQGEIGMCILAAFWGQGIGRAMMELSLEWARLRGLRKLFLKVYDDNERAIALYRSFGFVEEARLAGDVLRADGTYGDSIIMVRYLAGALK